MIRTFAILAALLTPAITWAQQPTPHPLAKDFSAAWQAAATAQSAVVGAAVDKLFEALRRAETEANGLRNEIKELRTKCGAPCEDKSELKTGDSESVEK